MIRIVIIAPGMAVRAGLRTLLGDDPRLQVIAEAASPAELDTGQAAPDVVIWSPAHNINREDELLEIGQILHWEGSAVLVIHNDPKAIRKLAQLPVRVWGVLNAEATQAELLAAILALHEGLAIADPVWLKQAFASREPGAGGYPELAEPLTERETEILQLLAYGLTNKQIALRLNISAHTVKFHVSSIFTKLGTTNRVEAVNLGLKRGLILL